MDNLLNGNDVDTNNYFNNLLPKAKSIHHEQKIVLANHQITSLHLIQLSTGHANDHRAIEPLGIVIYSQLASLELQPNKDTNVITADGQTANVDDKNNQQQEKALYVLNQAEASKILSAGAYDYPQDFDEDLNTAIRGLLYQRATKINLSSAVIQGKQGISLSHAVQVKPNEMKVTMANTNDGMACFAGDTTDNDFAYLLSQTTADIAEDIKNHNNGYQVSHDIVGVYGRHSKKTSQLLTQMVNSLSNQKLGGVATGTANEPDVSQSASESVSVANDINLKQSAKSSSSSSELTNTGAVTTQSESVPNELNLSVPGEDSSQSSSSSSVSGPFGNDSESSASNSSESTNAEHGDNNGVDKSATATPNELNLNPNPDSQNSDNTPGL